MTKQEYKAWLNQAPAGSLFIYHVGELARDRGRYGPKMEWIPNPLDEFASQIYEDSERGLVTLTQERRPYPYLLDSNGFLRAIYAYRAQRTSKEM